MHFPVKLKFHCTLKLRLVIRLVGWIATPVRREILHTPVHIQVYKTSLQQSLHPGKQKTKVGGGRRLGPRNTHSSSVCSSHPCRRSGCKSLSTLHPGVVPAGVVERHLRAVVGDLLGRLNA